MGIIDRIKNPFPDPSGNKIRHGNTDKNPSLASLSADKVNISGKNGEAGQEIKRSCFQIAKEGLDLLQNEDGSGIKKAAANISEIAAKSGDPFLGKMAKLSLYVDKEKSFGKDTPDQIFRSVFKAAMSPITTPLAPMLANFCLTWTSMLDDRARMNTNQDVLKTISKHSKNPVEAETARVAKNEVGFFSDLLLKFDKSEAADILISEDRVIQGALRSIGWGTPKDAPVGPLLARTALGVMEGGKNPPNCGYENNVKVAETYSEGILKYSKDGRERFLLKTAMRFDYSQWEQQRPRYIPREMNAMRKNKALRNTLEEIAEGINVPLEATLARIGTSVMLGNYEKDNGPGAKIAIARPFAEAILSKSGDPEIKAAVTKALESHDKLPVSDKGRRIKDVPNATVEKVETAYRKAFDEVKLKALMNTPIANESREDREQIIKILGYDVNSSGYSDDPHKKIDDLLSKYALVTKYHRQGDSVTDTASLVRKLVDQIKIECYEGVCWDSGKRNRNDYFLPDRLLGKISEVKGSLSAGELTGAMSVFDGSKEVSEKSYRTRAVRVTGVLRLLNLPSADEPIEDRAKAMNELCGIFLQDESGKDLVDEVVRVMGNKKDSIPSGNLGRLLNSFDHLKEHLNIKEKKEELAVFKFMIDEINKGNIRGDVDSLLKLNDQELDVLMAGLKSSSSTAGFDSGAMITGMKMLKLGDSKDPLKDRESALKKMESLDGAEKNLFTEDIVNVSRWKGKDESLEGFVGKFRDFRDMIKRFRKINEDDKREFEQFTCHSFGRIVNAMATGKTKGSYEEVMGEIEKLCKVFGNPEASIDAIASPEKSRAGIISQEDDEVIIGGIRLRRKGSE